MFYILHLLMLRVIMSVAQSKNRKEDHYMEQKLIDARFKKNPLVWLLVVVGLVVIIGGVIISFIDYQTGTDYEYKIFVGYVEAPNTEIYSSFADYFEHHTYPFDNLHMFLVYGGVLCILVSLFMNWLMSGKEMIITSNRVIGRASFGKRVDLPISQISAVALSNFDRIMVATSSGKIHFWLLENRADVYDALNSIIGKVQVEAARNNTSAASTSNAEELQKYKELLDNGVITQEEFDAKKKQLLGL